MPGNRKASGAVTGNNGPQSFEAYASQNTYQDYSQKTANTENQKLWKQQLDEQYAYRYALEKKFGKDALKNNEAVAKQLAAYEEKIKKQALRNQKKEELKQRKELGLADKQDKKELKKIETEERKEKASVDIAKSLEELPAKIGAAMSKALSNMTQKVGQYLSVFAEYSAGITTRLQGSEKTFATISDVISGKLAASPFVKQTEVLEKLNELVSAGISYNVEQRAFLAAMTDKMVTTFDAADATLLRIIRLQQADSTIARMGMESALNKFLNATYEDTSYLTDVYNSVESSLVDAISQLSVSAGTEFEYIVQKWLGSLYSVGMGSDTLTQIAEGINYLASGNVSALSSNTALQNLVVMGANEAGLNYSQMLTGGISTTDLNKLLAGIVNYAQGLAETDNLVVKNQYAQLFGLTMSDMTALLQMGDDLSYVIEQELSYADAIAETNSQLKSVGSRVPISEMITNVFDNIMLTAANGIANNAGTYVTWLVTDLLEQAGAGINIPFISVLGSGVDLNATVTDLMKIGIMGFSLLGQIGNIIGGISSGGSLSLEGWGATEYTSRGTGFTGITAGVQQTTSQSLAVGNSGGEDIASGSVTQAQNEAKQSVSGQETEEQEMMDEIRNNVATMTNILKAVFDDNNALRVRVLDYGLVSTNPDNSGL